MEREEIAALDRAAQNIEGTCLHLETWSADQLRAMAQILRSGLRSIAQAKEDLGEELRREDMALYELLLEVERRSIGILGRIDRERDRRQARPGQA